MLDILSPKGRLFIKRIMRFGGLLLIVYNAFIRFSNNGYLMTIIITSVIFAVMNDYIREKFLKKQQSFSYCFSYILSNAICAYLSYQIMCDGTVLYNIVLIVDLLFTENKIPAFLLSFNFIAYCISIKFNMNPEINYSLMKIFLNYLGNFIVVYIMRGLFVEKVRANQLNDELISANMKLKEYSKKIEALTVSNERTRIAQELHDSMGHLLMALSMNLEYAENVVESKPEKAKEVIIKSYNISKECIVKLREVVSLLKEDLYIVNLREVIYKLFENFYNKEKYKFNLKMYKDIESEMPNIKNCIYKTIMECITNGIRHGKADTFDIDIEKNDNKILIRIRNNGLGCSNIKKANGTKGIEGRIINLGGTVRFYSENGAGFTIDASIPIGEIEK